MLPKMSEYRKKNNETKYMQLRWWIVCYKHILKSETKSAVL